jgi:hypothetical protein
MTVYAVEWGNEFPAEIDSLWLLREDAEKRAAEKNDKALGGKGWHVTEWLVG